MNLEISREPVSMDRHTWVRVPVIVDLNGQPHHAPEWGMAGVVLEPFQDVPPDVGAAVSLHMSLPYKGFEISFEAPAVVESWEQAERRLVIGFRGLKARERELMAHCIASIELNAGGAAAQSIDSLMQRLAVVRGNATAGASPVQPPVTNHAIAADPAPLMPPGPWWRRATRTAAVGSSYGVLGLAVAGYLGYAGYRHLAWLDVSGATLAAPVESILSMGDGAVRWTTFKPGDAVKAGDVVLNIFDNVLEREIEQAAIAVREREAKVAFLKRRVEYERLRMVGLGQVSSQKSLQIQAEIEGLRLKLKQANIERRQLSSATPGPLAQVRQRIVGLQQAMAMKELELKGRAALADKTDGRMALVGQQLVGDSGTLEAQLEMEEAEVQLAEERHQAFLDQRSRLTVKAPFDGVLRQLTRFDTANIKRGDVAAVIEQGGDRGVRAVLRQDQALRLSVGAKAEVRVPATGQTFAATVAEIEPSSWSNGSNRDGEQAKGSGAVRHSADESQLVVRLTFANPRLLDNSPSYRAGLPVVALIQTGTPVSTTRAAVADAAGRVGSSATAAWARIMTMTSGARTSLAPALDTGSKRWRDLSERAAETVVSGSRVWRTKLVDQIAAWKQRREAAADSAKSSGQRG
jgi:multidrug resistance efflux pump